MLELDGDGRLAGRRQTGQPDGQTALLTERTALRTGNGCGVVGDVAMGEKRTLVFVYDFLGIETLAIYIPEDWLICSSPATNRWAKLRGKGGVKKTYVAIFSTQKKNHSRKAKGYIGYLRKVLQRG